MRIVFIGSVKFSSSILNELIRLGCEIVGVCAKPEPGVNADYCDIGYLALNQGVPYIYATDINSREIVDWIAGKKPDVIFCIGWSQILKNDILRIPKIGVIGFHPSELPKNRGRHPIIWALVLGLKQTGSTFFFMDKGVDSGDVISQEIIPISENDNASSLYEKITKTAISQINHFVPKLQSGLLPRVRQDGKAANLWRKRSEADGLIDWRMTSKSIHNLVRGLASPYIGAHFVHNDEKIRVWRTELVRRKMSNIEPGRVIDRTKDGIIVKCGEGSILLLDIEPSDWQPKGDYL